MKKKINYQITDSVDKLQMCLTQFVKLRKVCHIYQEQVDKILAAA